MPANSLFPTEPEVVMVNVIVVELAEELTPKPADIAAVKELFIAVSKAAGVVALLTPITVAVVEADAAPPEKDCAETVLEDVIAVSWMIISPAAAVVEENETLFELSAVPPRFAVRIKVPSSQSSDFA